MSTTVSQAASTSIVACGTVRPEIRRLAEEGFLEGARLLFTAPGLHEWPGQLEKQLTRQLDRACDAAPRPVVAYGEKCFIDPANPSRVTETLIREICPRAARVQAANCVDMLAGAEERARLAGSDKVYWLTPGWLLNWDAIFKDWDAAKANETFPQHDRAVVLDGIGFFEAFSATEPERLLEISDWMRLPIEAAPISLERLRRLLLDQASRLDEGAR
jgi:hypothetical protein